MIFKELIEDLKKVKAKKDVNENVAAHLRSAAIAAQITLFANQGRLNPEEAFDMTRLLFLKELDAVLLEILDDEEMDDDLPHDLNFDSPMNDPQLNADIQKAMKAYNDRLKK